MTDSIRAILLGAAALLAACDDSKTEQPAASAPPDKEEASARTRCFSMLEGKDLTAIQIQQDGNAISGYYAWEPSEKDGSHGVLNGEISDGLIKASHTYMIEGTIQTEETYFKLESDRLLQGSGELVEDNGVMVVKDPASLQFTDVLKETDCANVKDAITNAEQTSNDIVEQSNSSGDGDNGLDLSMLGENLIGDWQSTQDPKAHLSIDENSYRDIYDGKQLDSSAYEVLASCPEACGKTMEETPCLQVQGKDMLCYAILTADGETLELSLLTGTGNVNQYQRINSATQQPQ
ncbi:hypothetical protein VSS37_17895 [Candidatus Thiothrix sp. Deng01]|uniref:Lipoprotein n=1 Tax=Candidatus Thiothrix phosphatis TaxID=3112415 RepID=A0ABU6D1C2_9GAMM|nr:hypothetical protein [Candidatus Thiothrix sp. Deng01]MEB4592856.1 hypothetical protein [Candidatus Thiothrix sp. Deng01]